MSFADPRKVLSAARRGNYGVAAFNISTLETVQATIWGAEKESSPVFLMVHRLTEEYTVDVDTYVEMLKLYIADSKAPIVLHHDHCGSFEEFKAAVDRGFQSAMFDGSALSFEENIEATRRAVDYAHEHGVLAEAELGFIPAMEAVDFGGAHFTVPEQVPEYIERTGCDCLAIAVGNAHGGVHYNGHIPFDFERLQAIMDLCPDYPFVLHGGASLPAELIASCNSQGGAIDEMMHICSEPDIAKACAMCVSKVNMDVDNWLAYTAVLRKCLNEKPEIYNPLTYQGIARNGWEQEVRHKIRNVLRSSGRAAELL